MISRFAGRGQEAPMKGDASRESTPPPPRKDKAAYLREWRRQVRDGERTPKRRAHPSPWCREAGHDECHWLRSEWGAAKREGRMPVDTEHPWRHKGCEPCRKRRADYSREWMSRNRKAYSELPEEQKVRARERNKFNQWRYRNGVPASVPVRLADPSRCQGCGVPVLEHDLLRRCG